MVPMALDDRRLSLQSKRRIHLLRRSLLGLVSTKTWSSIWEGESMADFCAGRHPESFCVPAQLSPVRWVRHFRAQEGSLT